MPILVEKNIAIISKELKERIKGNKGVEICIRQKSQNFENWVQVEMCDILSCIIDPNDIRVENKGIDIVAVEKSNHSKIKLAIEIKVIPLGPEGRYDKRCKNGTEDIKRKLGSDAQSAEKALLFIVYDILGKGARKKMWSQCRKDLLMGNKEIIDPIDFEYAQTKVCLDLIPVS